MAALLLPACATLGTGRITPQAGAAQACRDLKEGKVKVLVGGGLVILAPGVPEKDARFAKLRREGVPSGCTTPHAAEWFEYARGYNEVVVEHVIETSGKRKAAR